MKARNLFTIWVGIQLKEKSSYDRVGWLIGYSWTYCEVYVTGHIRVTVRLFPVTFVHRNNNA